MQERSVYVEIEDQKKIEEELKSGFIWSILAEELELPIDDIWGEDDELTVQKKIELRAALNQYEIDVINSSDGGVKIYFQNHKIAEWFKPYIILRKKDSLRKSESIYYEMIIKWWSMFDEQKEGEL